MGRPVKGGSELWEISGRNQDNEKLTFLSTTLGDHMVLQRAPQQAVLWGFTTPGAVVTTTMAPSACFDSGDNSTNDLDCGLQVFTATANSNGTWRQKLPPTPASKLPYDFICNSSGPLRESAQISDVLFGDVYVSTHSLLSIDTFLLD